MHVKTACPSLFKHEKKLGSALILMIGKAAGQAFKKQKGSQRAHLGLKQRRDSSNWLGHFVEHLVGTSGSPINVSKGHQRRFSGSFPASMGSCDPICPSVGPPLLTIHTVPSRGLSEVSTLCNNKCVTRNY